MDKKSTEKVQKVIDYTPKVRILSNMNKKSANKKGSNKMVIVQQIKEYFKTISPSLIKMKDVKEEMKSFVTKYKENYDYDRLPVEAHYNAMQAVFRSVDEKKIVKHRRCSPDAGIHRLCHPTGDPIEGWSFYCKQGYAGL